MKLGGMLCLALLATQSFALDLTIQELNRKLNANRWDSKSTWTAAENEMSKLSFDEAKIRMGAILPADFQNENIFESEQQTADNIDWRNHEGKRWNSPVLNQGRCGSCVAFAAVTTLETQMNITRKTPNSPWAYSPQHLFSCGGGGCGTGWQPYAAAAYLKSKGVPDEACYPYKSGSLGEDQACSNTCSDAAARSVKVVNTTMPSSFMPNPTAVKAALKKGPLMAVMYVYEDFLFYKSGIYKHVTGKMAGGHAVTLIGYNDTERYWIIQNSWGEEWGEKGYVRISYDDTSGIGTQTTGLEVPTGEGYVTLGSVRDYEVLSGKVEVDVQSTVSGVENVEIAIKEGKLPIAWARAKDRLVLDTTKQKDGAYVIYANATTGGKTTTSQPRNIYILNGTFKGALKVLDMADGDTLTAEKKFHVEVTSNPIPFTKLVFRTKNLATGETSARSTGVAFPKMQIGWRAHLIPNGKYEVRLEGYVGNKLMAEIKPMTINVQHAEEVEVEEEPID